MPKLSIILTAYNIEDYIRQSLDDILAQTLQDIEIIVVDDGSTDATPGIIRDYAGRDPRIRPILFEQNTVGGVGTAANAGLDAATGDYIGFADGDDRYDPGMFERLHAEAEAHSADLAMCGYQLMDDSDGTLTDPADTFRWRPYTGVTAVDLDTGTRREILRFVAVPWRKIYRRDLVERVELRFPVGDYFFEDNPFHWAAVLGAERVVMVPEVLCRHRVARAGQTMATADSRLLRIFLHHDTIRDWLRRYQVEETFRPDLLRWTAGQLSWVSQRTEGPLRRELSEILTPVVAQYDSASLEAFGDEHGRGRSYRMLVALKAGDYEAFSRAAGDGPSGNAGAGARHASGSLVARGLYHLKNSGLRQTARMTARYMGDRTGMTPILRRRAPERDPISNSDLMAAMVVLQSDLRRLRAEVEMLRAERETGETEEAPSPDTGRDSSNGRGRD